jgi:hypothetical protein
MQHAIAHMHTIAVHVQEEQALAVGIQTAAPGHDQFNSVQDCMKACDDAGDACVGVSFKTTVEQSQIGKTCSFVQADLRPGVFKRSMVRASLQRLTLRLAFLCPSGFVASDAASPCKPVETPQAVVLLLTATGTCSAQVIETVKAAFTEFFTNPQTAFGKCLPVALLCAHTCAVSGRVCACTLHCFCRLTILTFAHAPPWGCRRRFARALCGYSHNSYDDQSRLEPHVSCLQGCMRHP